MPVKREREAIKKKERRDGMDIHIHKIVNKGTYDGEGFAVGIEIIFDEGDPLI